MASYGLLDELFSLVPGGGPPGYQGMLEALSDPNHPERAEFLDWLGADDFDPEAFDLDQANAALRRVR